MSLQDSKIDGENDMPHGENSNDSYQSNAGAINAMNEGERGTDSVSETFDRVGTAASEYKDAEAGPLNRTMEGVSQVSDDNVFEEDSPLKWIAPLVLLLLLIVLGYWFCGKTTTSVSRTVDTVIQSPKTTAA